MNAYPVFARELRCAMTNHAFRKQRLVAGTFAALGFAVLLALDEWNPGFKLNRFIAFWPLVSMLPFTLLIIGLSRGGNVLSKERREGTLPLLLITRLSGHDIIIGKLFQTLFLELTGWLVIIPMLVLPLLGAGLNLSETLLLVLACLNMLFYALSLGLLASVFFDGRVAASWCLLALLPFVIYSTPLGRLIPGGPLSEWMSRLQWLNPCDAISHAQAAAWGFRGEAYWSSLLATHLMAWVFIALGGLLLPFASRWHAGTNAGPPAKGKWWTRMWTPRIGYPPLPVRTRMLNCNPYLWLTSRDRWVIPRIWIWLFIPLLAWGGFGWLSYSRGGLNVIAIFASAVGATWYIIFLATIPAHTCRQIVADRLNGTLELILCTPLGTREVARGVWLSAYRHFLAPLITAISLGVVIMIAGYQTSGFGGMLDPDDLGPWLFSWSAHIVLLPLFIFALSWVSLRRALFTPDAGAASGIAFVQVVFTFWLVLWVLYQVAPHSSRTWTAVRLSVAAVLVLTAFAWYARRKFFQNLRCCASPTHNSPSSTATHVLRPRLCK